MSHRRRKSRRSWLSRLPRPARRHLLALAVTLTALGWTLLLVDTNLRVRDSHPPLICGAIAPGLAGCGDARDH